MIVGVQAGMRVIHLPRKIMRRIFLYVADPSDRQRFPEVSTFCVSATSQDSGGCADWCLNAMLERFDRMRMHLIIRNQSTNMEAMENVTNTLALLLGGSIAAISAGGRNRHYEYHAGIRDGAYLEIGIRKAIGAGRGQSCFSS